MEKLDQATGQAPIGVGRNAELFQWDVELLDYPWGETRLRPYLLTGMGLSNIYFTDRLGESYQVTSLSCRWELALSIFAASNWLFVWTSWMTLP